MAAQAAHHLRQDRARRGEVQPRVAAAGGAAQRPVDQRDAGALVQHLRRVRRRARARAGPARPGRCPRAGRSATSGRCSASSCGEGVPVAVEVRQHPVEPRAAVRVRRGRRPPRPVATPRASPRSGGPRTPPRSASLERISCPHASPGRFHALEADVAVTVCPAAVGDERGVGHVLVARVGQRRVDLVGEHPPAVPVHHRAHRAQLVGGEHAPEGVVRVGEHQQLAARAEGGVDAVEIERGPAVERAWRARR